MGVDGGERFGAPGEAGGARFGTGRDGAALLGAAPPPGDCGGARRGGARFGTGLLRGGGRFGAPRFGGFLPGVAGGLRPGTDGEGLLGGRRDGVAGLPPGEPPACREPTRGGGRSGFGRDIIGGGTPSVDVRNIELQAHNAHNARLGYAVQLLDSTRSRQ